MKLNELRAQLKATADKIEALSKLDALTEEQAADFDKLQAEFDELRAQTERAQKAEDNAKFMAAARPSVVQQAATNPTVQAPAPDAPKHFENFGEFMHAVRFNNDDQRLGEWQESAKGGGGFQIPSEYNTGASKIHGEQRYDDGPSGGFAVPEQFDPTVRMVEQSPGSVRPLANVMPAGTPPDAKITMPALDQTAAQNMYGGVTVSWIGEGGEKPDTSAKLREVSLEPHEVAASLTVTDKLLRNWSAASPFLESLLMRAKMAEEDKQFIDGNGVAKPQGFLQAACARFVSRTAPNQIQYDDLVEMEKLLLTNAMPVWITTRRSTAQLRKLVDAGNNLIWQENTIRGRTPPALMGYPVILAPRMPSLGSKGDISLVDLSHYLIKDGSGPFVAASEHVKFTQNKTVIKCFWNVDGRSWLNDAIVEENGDEQSPFIGLDVP